MEERQITESKLHRRNAANARKFNVALNGTQVLTNYDIFAAAGGQNKAIIREFTCTPNGSGQIIIAYTAGTADQPKSSGIEIILPQPAAPTSANNGPLWAGMNLNLTASTVSGATYSWTGPSGFASTNQNPAITNATTNLSGLFSVQVVISGCASPSATTSVTIKPLAKVAAQYVGGSVVLNWPTGTLQTASNIAGPWTKVSGAITPRTNSVTAHQEFFRIQLQ